MRLNRNDQKIQAVLAGAVTANECTWHTDCCDFGIESRQERGVVKDGVTASDTAVDIVDAPGRGQERLVENIQLHNADTASVTLTIQLVNGSNTRTLFKVTLATLENLVYTKDGGWQAFTVAGALK